jgi:lipid-A-disaccharide synthase
MIIAGEASGDTHGAAVIKELKALDPKINIFGIGGDKMINEGMSPEYHIRDMAFLGVVEVVKHLPFIKKVQKRLLQIIEDKKVKTVVLIDYPGFNLNLAKKIKGLGVKIIYYISPQIWAWGKGRIHKIKKIVDKMIVVFPFEKEMYNQDGVDADYVGHPLVEQINEYLFLTREELYRNFNLTPGKEILLILPGSRKHEIEKIFPKALNAAMRLEKEFDLQTIVAGTSNIDESFFDKYRDIGDFKLITGRTYDLLANAKFGIIKSGTSTLEAGIFKLPFVVVYSTSALTYTIGRRLVKIDRIALANIVAEEQIVDELIQNDFTEEKLYQKVSYYLNNDHKLEEIKTKLGKLNSKLGSPGASGRAANIIYQQMNEA